MIWRPSGTATGSSAMGWAVGVACVPSERMRGLPFVKSGAPVSELEHDNAVRHSANIRIMNAIKNRAVL